MLCLTRVHSEQGKFGPRIEDYHNDPISVQVLFTPVRPWHMTTGFWETAPHVRQGHRCWLFLSTGMSSEGHREEPLWAENRWSLLPLQKLTEGRIKCAHRIEQAAGCLWPLTSLPFTNHIARSLFPWIMLRQTIITSLQDLCKSIPVPVLISLPPRFVKSMIWLLYLFFLLFLWNHQCAQLSCTFWPYHLYASLRGKWNLSLLLPLSRFSRVGLCATP